MINKTTGKRGLVMGGVGGILLVLFASSVDAKTLHRPSPVPEGLPNDLTRRFQDRQTTLTFKLQDLLVQSDHFNRDCRRVPELSPADARCRERLAPIYRDSLIYEGKEREYERDLRAAVLKCLRETLRYWKEGKAVMVREGSSDIYPFTQYDATQKQLKHLTTPNRVWVVKGKKKQARMVLPHLPRHISCIEVSYKGYVPPKAARHPKRRHP